MKEVRSVGRRDVAATRLGSVVGFFAAIASSAFAQATGPDLPVPVDPSARLTLAQAMAIALRQSPVLQASKYTVEGSKANLAGQRAPANPTFIIGGLNNTVSSLGLDDPSDYAVLFTIETNGAIAWRTSQARNQLLGARADALNTVVTLHQSVVSAYIDLQVANAALANEESAYSTTQKLSELTEKQFKLGAAPETNAIRAQIAVTQEESSLLSAIGAVKSARANLNIQMGRNADEPVDAADPLAFNPTQFDKAALHREAEENRADLRSAEFNLKALKAAVGLQRTQYLPNVFIGTDDRIVREGHFQVGLAMPLFDFGSIGGAVRKAQQDVKVQESQIVQLRQSIGLDVETAYDSLTRAQRTVEAFQSGILPRTAALLDRIEKGYALGASTILDLIDAENTYRSARNDYASALGDALRAQSQVERAAGKVLPAGSTPSAELRNAATK